MAQACTPTIITLSGCPHCANLESMLNNAQIKYTVDMSQACQCYPCAVLCDGSHVTSCGGDPEVDCGNDNKDVNNCPPKYYYYNPRQRRQRHNYSGLEDYQMV